MPHLCTICCKDKRTNAGLLPAVERYLSARIAWAAAESARRGLPFLILSGKYGLITPQTPIPWYDQKLTPAGVAALVPLITRQLGELGVERILFYGRPAEDADWQPYHRALEEACQSAGVALERHALDME